MKSLKILAIETSCDETAAAVVENGNQVLSNMVFSQIDLHKKYGGVVPEIASRAHIEKIIPVIEEALSAANSNWNDIGAIAVTNGPGLLGSLLVGVNTARTLSYIKGKPLIPVHHIEGHIYANFVSHKPKFPLLALVVSGGHSSLIFMEDHLKYEILGETIDDAAGEVFDKVAKILDLGYPGGPIVSKLAEKGDKKAYDFPRTDLTPKPKRDKSGYLVHPKPSLDFSFSGLKTAVLNEVRKCQSNVDCELSNADLCASFQQTVIDILVRNSVNAVKMYKTKSFVLCGGVSANKELGKQLEKAILDEGLQFLVPDFSLATDNAAMIGAAAFYRHKESHKTDWQNVAADPNLKLKNSKK